MQMKKRKVTKNIYIDKLANGSGICNIVSNNDN